MPEAFWEKLERLVVSAFPNKFTPAMRTLAEYRSKKHGFFFGVREYREFYKQFKLDPDAESFKDCPWRLRCWTVHDGYFFLCPQSAFFPDSFMGLPQTTDGLRIDKNLTEQRLSDFINRKAPLASCQICHSYKEIAPWHEITTNRADWVMDSMNSL
jgi:hypothetical protein